MGGNHPLSRQFAVAVRVDRIERVRFLKEARRRWRSIDGGRGREDQPSHARAPHGGQHGGHAVDIVIPVEVRMMHRSAHLDQSGEVDHPDDPVVPHRLREALRIAHIALNQRPPQHRLFVPVGEIVVNDRLVAGL